MRKFKDFKLAKVGFFSTIPLHSIVIFLILESRLVMFLILRDIFRESIPDAFLGKKQQESEAISVWLQTSNPSITGK